MFFLDVPDLLLSRTFASADAGDGMLFVPHSLFPLAAALDIAKGVEAGKFYRTFVVFSAADEWIGTLQRGLLVGLPVGGSRGAVRPVGLLKHSGF